MKEKKMKRFLLTLAALAALGVSLPAQENSKPPMKSEHYEIRAMDDAALLDLSMLARELELRFGVYNQLFRYDPQSAPLPLKVRVFTTQPSYDAYVSERLGDTRPGAVYLHYSQADKRELCVFRGSAEETEMLPHQAFIQFFRAFVSNPPAWMREGFAVYFNTLRFDPAGRAPGETMNGSLTYEENLSWLEYIKALGQNKTAPTLRSVLQADSSPQSVNQPPDNFQAAAWALVSFFLGSGMEDYYRTITDCFLALDQNASASENTIAVMRRISLWTDFSAMERDYKAYLDSRKTFNELIEEGRKAFTAGDFPNAEMYFTAAMYQKPAHYASYYYLGLIYYEQKKYAAAEEYYKSSLSYGADPGLVSYALGINAAMDERTSEAIRWLEQAATANPSRYREKVDALLVQLR
jgi:tetratricopeptide (TPR) repeat protein